MKKFKVHLICNAHLDPVWQWRWEEGCAETLATFRNAVTLLEEHPHLIFNHNESVLYRWVKQYDPALFRDIQRLVKSGRWSISGGWYLQPDVNLPSTESLIRHITEGRRFFKDNFQAEPRVAYNFDSFGHSGGLPQILNRAGYKMYIHLRPQSNDLVLPADLYRWQGVNGSEVIGYRIAVGLYHTEYNNLEQRLKEGAHLAFTLKRDVPVFWGIGNHGGGATREDLKIIDQFISQNQDIDIIHSTPDQFYLAIKDLSRKAPLVKGELQRVFTGCYTSLSRIKRGAVKSLHELIQAEILRTASWWLSDQDFPVVQMATIWRNHLFNDFHDILPGTCTEPAEKDALDLYGRVSESVRQMRLCAVTALNREPSHPVYIPITVVNTNPALSYLPVEVECMISHRPMWSGTWHLRVSDFSGREISSQEEQPEALLPFNGWRRKLCFMAQVPAIGIARFSAQAVKGEKEQVEMPPALSFTINPEDGLIHELHRDKMPNCLKGPLLKPLVVEDTGDSWGTDCSNYRNNIQDFQADPGSIQVIEKGAVRTIQQSIYTFNNSRIVMNCLTYAQWPVVEFRLRIHWNEEQKRLKLSIPTTFNANQILCEVPGGIITRPADGEEHVHGRCMLLGTADQQWAMAIVNNGQHGYDFQNGEVRLSVLRSAAYCHEQGLTLQKYPARKYMDQGIHDIRILVTIGIRQELLDNMSALADWVNMPPVVYAHLPFGAGTDLTAIPAGDLSEKSFLNLDTSQIRLLACKQSWDTRALIIRLQEISGRAGKTILSLPIPDLKIPLVFKPLEIKTIRIERDGEWREADLIWEK